MEAPHNSGRFFKPLELLLATIKLYR